MTAGALLIGGTSSDAGKSVVVAGLCRLLARKGIRVAPFKAQNMSNNSTVTVDGGEIGRAQAMQARAAGLDPSIRFNPVLLKPGSDRSSQLVVRGAVSGTVNAANYHVQRAALADVVNTELSSLRNEFDVVICEGAGSIAEINLRATDLANMGLARAADIPVVVVGDIDRGGLLAHLFGSVAILTAEDQALVAGFLVNKFRGDTALLEPGLEQLRQLTGRPTYGVIPYAGELWLDTEDSLSVHGGLGIPAPARGSQGLTVAAIRLPRISNTTDIEALACEPGVTVRWVTDQADIPGADIVILPGTRATVADLAWLRKRGLATAITAHAGAGKAVLGICGGFQMLCVEIIDAVEQQSAQQLAPGSVRVAGLGLIDARIEFDPEKTLARHDGPLAGYEIHHGQVRTVDAEDWLGVGHRSGAVFGTHWHGLLDNNTVRRQWLTEAADAAGRTGFEVAADTDVPARRDAQLDVIADLLTAHTDVDAMLNLLDHGAPRHPAIVIGPR